MDLKITGAKLSGDAEKDVKILANRVFQLEEQLRYQLRNLDVTNFNDLGLARYENGRMQAYAKQVEIQAEKLRLEFGEETDDIYAEISATAEELLAEIEGVNGNYASLSATVDGLTARVGDAEGNYSSLSQTVSGIQTTVKGHTTTINNHTNTLNNHTNSINSHGNSIVSLQSQIKQTANEIAAVVSAVDDSNGYVTAASIVAAINNAGSSVKISADHVNISGDFVTVSDLAGTGKVEINAGNIAANGTISGCRLETAKDGITNIVIDGAYIKFTDYASIKIGSDGRMGIFSERSQLDITGYGGIRLFDADRFPSGYWELYAWGMAFIDARTGEPVRHITAVNYT